MPVCLSDSGRLIFPYFLEVGNTKVVSDYIQAYTGADQFEVVAEKSYDMPYRDLIKVAQEEQRKGEKPAIKGTDARTSKERVEKWLKELGY